MEKFDVIVVGAGPAGVTASARMAREGLRVLLLERAQIPGQKNMFGGMMPYCPALEEVVPRFYEVAPIERVVTRRTLSFLSEADLTMICFESRSFEVPPQNGYTLFRPLFDR
jgi:electron transfer flavoprotein-quinone oxidoreductase